MGSYFGTPFSLEVTVNATAALEDDLHVAVSDKDKRNLSHGLQIENALILPQKQTNPNMVISCFLKT